LAACIFLVTPHPETVNIRKDAIKKKKEDNAEKNSS
jgi:hypothetical protein